MSKKEGLCSKFLSCTGKGDILKIWIDADACPVVIKEFIYKAADRLKIETTLVANQYMRVPLSPYISCVCVEKSFDAADFYIVKECGSHDLVITADVPLASGVIQKGAIGIDPRGRVFDSQSIADQLSMRNLLQTLREGRIISGGGPRPFQTTDKQKFATSFEMQLSILRKRAKD